MAVATSRHSSNSVQAEGIDRRFALLTRASEILASSLDYELTLRQVAWLAVPELADFCSMQLVDAEGSVTRLTVAHADPNQAALAKALERADLPLPGATPGVLQVLRTGRPILFPQIGEAEFAYLSRGPEHLRLIRAARLESVIAVPLIARGRRLGVLAMATAHSGRTYTTSDVALATELASRCALAVDNARLYRETHEALRRKEESLALVDTLLSAAPDGIGFLDEELRWVRLNDALAATLGMPVERLLGRSVVDGGAAHAHCLEPLLRHVLQTGEPIVDRDLSREPTALSCQERHYLLSVYPVQKPSGDVLGVGLVVVDITERKRAEDELRESEARSRRLVETAYEGIWLVDTQLNTTFVNQRMANMLGYQPDEINGTSILEFVVCPSCARERIGHNLAGISEQLDVTFRHRDGSLVLVLGGTSPLTNGRGEIVGVLGMFFDITERTQAEAERDQLLMRERAARAEAEAAQRHLALLARASELMASTLDYEATLRQIAWLAVPELADFCALYRVESDGTARLGALAYADPAHADLARAFERARPLFPGQLQSMAQPVRAEIFSEVTDEVLKAVAPDEEALRLLRSLGIRSKMQVPMVVRGRAVGVLMLASTDAARQYGQPEIALAQQLAERCAVALENAVLVSDLRRALGVREELLAATSHELRTPLAHIKGFTSTLRQRDIEWDEETRQDLLAEIEREADRLTGLISDLLSMSRLESGVSEVRARAPIAPATLISAGLDRVRGLLGGARVQVDLPDDLPPVVVDASQLEQVVANLVENAAKYGHSNVQIRITAARRGDELEIAVDDDGPGILADDLERIFDKFFRALSSKQSGVSGTGLGLAICRAIVQAHDGRIWAEKGPRGGACFVVRLPLEARRERGPD